MKTHSVQIGFITPIIRAVSRARWPILSVALIYLLSILAGILMVHTNNSFALSQRDKIVGQAQQRSITQAYCAGENIRAALLDAGGNLLLGAVPKTLAGIGVIFPYPFVVYQGWIGGIVSVRGDHTSRLDHFGSAFYYLLTLFLQVIPYSLAIGAGVNVGLAMFRPAEAYQGKKWLNLFPKEALRDLGRIYVLVVPLFLIASLWEFLGPWNF